MGEIAFLFCLSIAPIYHAFNLVPKGAFTILAINGWLRISNSAPPNTSLKKNYILQYLITFLVYGELRQL